MAEAPWLSSEKQELVNLLLISHQQAFSYPLLACERRQPSQRLASQELFASRQPVLAHSDGHDPNLSYANAAALQLWGRRWAEMVGMPSRLTAPTSEQDARANALDKALQQDAIKDYQGIRINHEGRRFLIKNARIWTLWNQEGLRIGQAAAIGSWYWL
ncbi:MEKHLA domain-containing protein [Prochlorococcus marinus]|uniref:MEKHLA domain-containing protein n=1 Tax=Prochlorococcus marinus TaxID=1219 RepID=UPI0007B38BAD|nr:MEKHLA domain-containing protein [Prochlorococcus marinus]KZR73482.1 MEKHLA domain protein [Prochlorococcus marinus str. MIT 1320]